MQPHFNFVESRALKPCLVFGPADCPTVLAVHFAGMATFKLDTWKFPVDVPTIPKCLCEVGRTKLAGRVFPVQL